MNQKVYYKVLYLGVDSRLYSAVSCGTDLCLVYPVGEQVHAPIGKLFVFDTYRHAEEFRNEISNSEFMQIWECTVSEDIEPAPYWIPYVSMSLDIIRNFWNGEGEYIIFLDNATPLGTYLCSSLTLTYQVEAISSVEGEL